MSSWVGYVTGCAAPAEPLLGGGRHTESSRFATCEGAKKWVREMITANCEAHRPISAWGQNLVERAPEVNE